MRKTAGPRLTKKQVKSWKRILKSHHMIVFAWAMKNNKSPEDYELMFGTNTVHIMPVGSRSSVESTDQFSFDEALELAKTGVNIYAFTQMAHNEPLRPWEMGHGQYRPDHG